jgi:hypothetical protein
MKNKMRPGWTNSVKIALCDFVTSLPPAAVVGGLKYLIAFTGSKRPMRLLLLLLLLLFDDRCYDVVKLILLFESRLRHEPSFASRKESAVREINQEWLTC